MPGCSRLESCSFFNRKMTRMPSIAELYKRRLCLGDNTHCALYYLFSYLEKNITSLSPEKEEELSRMVADLYPNEIERVKSLLSSP